MKRYVIIAVLSLLVINVRSEEDGRHNKPSDKDELFDTDPNINITARRIRFEDDPQFLNQDYPSLDEQNGLPLRFEDGPSPERPGRVTFQDDNRVEEQDNYSVDGGLRDAPTRVTFQDDGRPADPGIKKKRRRRRRKPRYQQPPGQYSPGAPVPPGAEYPGFPGQPYPGGPGIGPGGTPFDPYYRPYRRPRQSFASQALSRVSEALTSIALYDDYQCVPRLLCEAAGGGALGSSPVLQSIAGLQPLLTLLAAYNGISTSPLFVFGRAVFLGMTSKGNTASCRYAYPQCPTDPEQLVHYLNNHNGGFFRFFNNPQPQIPQNVEQFYNQLGQYGFQQNYGLYDPNQGPQSPQFGNPPNIAPQNQQFGYQPNFGPSNYGLYPQPGDQNLDQQYGLYQPYPQNYGPQQNPQYPGDNYGSQPNLYPQPNYPPPQGNQQYGIYNNPYLGPPNPSFYANQFNYPNLKHYGSKYPNGSKYGIKNVRFKDNSGKSLEIEKRIQNKPGYLYIDSDVGNVNINSKWIFPENFVKSDDVKDTFEYNNGNPDNKIRDGRALKFPEENIQNNQYNIESTRKGKSIIFPESQSTKYINYYDYPSTQIIGNSEYNNNQNYDSNSAVVSNYGFNNNNYYSNSNRYVNSNNYYENNSNNVYSNTNTYSKYMYNNEDEDGVQTVYVVRGNGDPNHPEIIKVRPGEKVML